MAKAGMDEHAPKPNLVQKGIAAGGASLIAGLLTNPLEVVKVS